MKSSSALCGSAAKPVREMAGAEQRIFLVRDQAALFKRRSEVAGLLVGDDRAGVLLRREILADDLVKRKSVGTGQLDDSIERFRHRDPGQSGNDVVGEDWLKQRGRQAYGLSVGCGIGDVSLIAGKLVGPRGQVTGVDVDKPSLEIARLRAHEQKQPHVTFEEVEPGRLYDASG